MGFLPLFFYSTFKEQNENKNIFLPIVGYMTASFLITGALFRVMHWPGTSQIIMISQILLIVAFLPIYIVSVFRKANETKTNWIYILFIVGIGIAAIYMLFSLKPSRNIVDKYDTINKSNLNVSLYFKNKNDSLYSTIIKDDAKIKADQIELKLKEFEKIVSTIKNEVIKLSGNNVSLEDYKFKDNTETFAKVMDEDGNEIKLKNSFVNYRDYLLTLTKDEPQRQKINTFLDFYQFTGNIYEQHFERTSLIEAFAMLSGMQKNARIAEYDILCSLK